MTDYDVLLVSTEAETQIVAVSIDNVLLVDVYLQTEITVSQGSYEFLEISQQGPTGPQGLTGAVGPTLFTDIAAAAVSDITGRLNGIDQFVAKLTDTPASFDFSTVYQLSI